MGKNSHKLAFLAQYPPGGLYRILSLRVMNKRIINKFGILLAQTSRHNAHAHSPRYSFISVLGLIRVNLKATNLKPEKSWGAPKPPP